jgi:hypothetical protein
MKRLFVVSAVLEKYKKGKHIVQSVTSPLISSETLDAVIGRRTKSVLEEYPDFRLASIDGFEVEREFLAMVLEDEE